ncbi:MAG: hypothetical protein GWP14_08680 [Actinobacteria bacterium]|nr:hypothetical protein [Actinomycetota bacterium]
MPWLIPTDWLKNQIVTGIRTQFGREASISSIEISWAQGIIVRDITIERLEEFGPGNLFQASRLQLDFSPLRFMLGRRLGTVRVDQPSLWIVADAAGKPNLSSLPSPPETAGFDLISITNANLYFIDRAYDREGLISIPLISVARDVQSGQYRFLAEGEPTKTTGRPAFTLQVSFVPPSQQPALQETDVIGSAELAWLDFDLSLLTVPRMGRINCQAIGGKTSGRARLELYSDARIELYDCSARVDNLYLRLAKAIGPAESDQPPAEPTEVRIPRAQLSLRGSYEFISGELTVQDLSGFMDGLDFNTSFQGRFLETSGAFVPGAFSLAAKVQPSRLREQLPFLDRLFRQDDLTVTGSSSLALDFKQGDRIDRLDFSLDALDMGLHIPNLLHKSADIPCRIAFTAEIDQATGLVTLVEPLQAELASGNFSLDMHLAQSAPVVSFLDLLTRPAEIAGLRHWRWSQDYLRASLDISRVEDFAVIFPKLAPVLSSVKLTGPVQGQFRVGPPGFQDSGESPALADQSGENHSDDGRAVISATVSLPAEASMEVEPYFRKLSDKPLTLSFTARLAEKGYRIEDLKASGRLGDLALSVAKASFSLVPRTADVQSLDSPAAVFDLINSISAGGDFQLANAAVLPSAVVSLRPLKPAGDLSGRFDLRYASAEVLSLDLALDATSLACEIPKSGSDAESPVLIEKPLGITTELDLQFRVDLRESDDLTHKASHYFNLPALPFRARLAWKLADSLGSLQVDHKDGLYFDLRLPRLNLDTLSNYTPLLAELLEDYQLGGIAAVGLSGKLGCDLLPEEVNLTGDFTGIRCVLTGSTPESADHPEPYLLQKHPGVPLSCRASLTIGPSDDQGRHNLSLKSLTLDLAASRLDLKGNMLLRSADEFEPASIFSSDYKLVESLRRFEPFVRTELSSSGRIVFDKDLFDLLPRLAEIDRKWGLEGTLDYKLDLMADPYQATLKSTCDGGPDGLKLGPAQFKRMAQQLELTFTSMAERPTPSKTSLKLESLELDLLGQPLRLSAVMDLDEGRLIIPDLFVALGDSSAYCTARVQNVWTAPVGYVNLYSPLIDQPRLQDLALRLISSVSPRPTSVGNDSVAQEPPEAGQDTGGLRLPPMDIAIGLQCDRFIFEDPASRLKFDFEQVNFDSQLTSSSLAASFVTALNGGRVSNSLTVSLDEVGLPLTYRYEALELIGDENTAPMVSQLFPDMTVTGTITESRTITANVLHREGIGKFPKEQGRTVLREGVLVGPSAPRWVTRWFPSLSLTKYYFDVADCVFSRNPEDGSVTNDMVLIGKGRYNIYINGITMVDNTTNYTVGVDLSRFMTLEQRHNWRQFRVPLLTYSGKIVDHKWAKQTVSFTWPTRTAWEMLIMNNPLKTLIERRRQAD